MNDVTDAMILSARAGGLIVDESPLAPKPLGNWHWRPRYKTRNKGGGMKKRRGRKWKGKPSTHRKPKQGFFQAKFDMAHRVKNPSVEYVFLHRRTDDEWITRYIPITVPRCYSYPPRVHSEHLVRFKTVRERRKK